MGLKVAFYDQQVDQPIYTLLDRLTGGKRSRGSVVRVDGPH